MKKFFLTLFLFAAFSVNAFAVNNNRIPLTPTITPLRIFFAVLAVIGFVVVEYYFNKIREERVATRPERYQKKMAKIKEKKEKKNK